MEKLLPSTTSSFAEFKEYNMIYVDKTAYIPKLLHGKKNVLLTRPRRFGKSLFVDVLNNLFSGNKDVFEGTYIYDNWDWSQKYPVIKFDFAGGFFADKDDLKEYIHSRFYDNFRKFKIEFDKSSSIYMNWVELLRELHERYNRKVVILIDEYDKPITDTLMDIEIAKANRAYLRRFYAPFKEMSNDIQFSFFTGITKYSKVSLYSGVNQVEDLSLDPEFATLFGYTERELFQYFADYLAGRDINKIREWYNGYSWGGERVYNPVDVISCLKKGEYISYWCETGVTKPLFDVMRSQSALIDNLNDIFETGITKRSIISSSNIDLVEVDFGVMLFQAGYVTFSDPIYEGNQIVGYKLKFPNKEVKEAFGLDYLQAFLGKSSELDFGKPIPTTRAALESGDVEQFVRIIKAVVARIPYHWASDHNGNLTESVYASTVATYCEAFVGFDSVQREVPTANGRIDLLIRRSGKSYVIEFKVFSGDRKGEAMEQIIEKRYYDGELGHGNEVHLLGIEFDRETRKLGLVQHAIVGADGVVDDIEDVFTEVE